MLATSSVQPAVVSVRCLEAHIEPQSGDDLMKSAKIYARAKLGNFHRVSELSDNLLNPKWEQATFNFKLDRTEEKAFRKSRSSFCSTEAPGAVEGKLLPPPTKKDLIATIGVWYHFPDVGEDKLCGNVKIPLAEYPESVTVGWFEIQNEQPHARKVASESKSSSKIYLEVNGTDVSSLRSSSEVLDGAPQNEKYYDKLIDFVADTKNWEFITTRIVKLQEGFNPRAERVCNAVLTVLQSYRPFRVTRAFVAHIARKELEMTGDAMSLFRTNGLTPKIFSHIAHLSGRNFIIEVLRPLVMKAYATKKGFEIVPSRLKKGESLQNNVKNLQALCEMFMKRIYKSLNKIPLHIRFLGLCIEKVLRGHSKAEIFSCLASLFFLRYLCPAIVSPARYGVVDAPPTARSQRVLTLITKSIQRLVNTQVGFLPRIHGEMSKNSNLKPQRSNDDDCSSMRQKEPYMIVMDGFFKKNENKMRLFLSSLTAVPRHVRPDSSYFSWKDYVPGSLRSLHIALSSALEEARKSVYIGIKSPPKMPTRCTKTTVSETKSDATEINASESPSKRTLTTLPDHFLYSRLKKGRILVHRSGELLTKEKDLKTKTMPHFVVSETPPARLMSRKSRKNNFRAPNEERNSIGSPSPTKIRRSSSTSGKINLSYETNLATFELKILLERMGPPPDLPPPSPVRIRRAPSVSRGSRSFSKSFSSLPQQESTKLSSQGKNRGGISTLFSWMVGGGRENDNKKLDEFDLNDAELEHQNYLEEKVILVQNLKKIQKKLLSKMENQEEKMKAQASKIQHLESILSERGTSSQPSTPPAPTIPAPRTPSIVENNE